MIIFAFVVLATAALSTALFFWNLRYYTPARRTGSHPLPAVSVLIPARNEEQSIEASVRSVLASTDIEFEVIVGDDGSEDDTAAIVEGLSTEDSRVRLAALPSLPYGWCGKQFACQRLSELARFPVLCFLDADVRVTPSGLSAMVDTLRSRGAALLSGFPKQETETWLEQALIPLMHFLLLGFLPMIAMRRTNKPQFAAGCGQLFLADAACYRTAGGHAAIRTSRHDGLTLPRRFREAGFKTDLCDATGAACCRMYRTSREVVRGLLKNATEGLASTKRIVPFTFFLVAGQIGPLFLFLWCVWHGGHPQATFLASAALALSYLPRLIAACKFEQPFLGAVLHPLSILLLLGIQWYAFALALKGVPSTWKGRRYSTT